MQSVSPSLSRLGADVVARMAREVVTRANAVRLQLLASQFYEALKLELERTPRHEVRKVDALAAAVEQCRRSAKNCVLPHLMLVEIRVAIAMLNDGADPPPSDVVVRFRPQLIQGGRA
jgi:hypothetical protein